MVLGQFPDRRDAADFLYEQRMAAVRVKLTRSLKRNGDALLWQCIAQRIGRTLGMLATGANSGKLVADIGHRSPAGRLVNVEIRRN